MNMIVGAWDLITTFGSIESKNLTKLQLLNPSSIFFKLLHLIQSLKI